MHGGFGIKPGSAARDAEQRAREARDAGTAPIRANMGIRVGGQVGQKFELDSRPSGPGEALPLPRPAAATPVAAPVPKPAAPVPPPAEPSAAARVWGKFLGLFSRKQ
jgi:hypothetical protein